MNVLQGKKSISCANSVLPAFMGDSSPGNCRGEPLRVQIDATQNRLETLIGQLLAPRAGSANRTAVQLNISWRTCICINSGLPAISGRWRAKVGRVLVCSYDGPLFYPPLY